MPIYNVIIESIITQIIVICQIKNIFKFTSITTLSTISSLAYTSLTYKAFGILRISAYSTGSLICWFISAMIRR